MTEELKRIRRPGSVRLTEEQYEEMESLGLDSESAYVKYKLNGARDHLHLMKADEQESPATESSVHTDRANPADLSDKLAIQRLTLENQRLMEKLGTLSEDRETTLDGIPQKVNHLLQQELQKRDLEALKKDYERQEKEIDKLEKLLEKSQDTIEDRQQEMEELIKKLGLIEVGKALLPGAISGLSQRYPREMQGLASTLGALSGEEAPGLPASSLDAEQQQLLQIAQYFRELFTEAQFEQLVQMISQMGEQIQQDEGLIRKIIYYLNQLKKMGQAKPSETTSDA